MLDETDMLPCAILDSLWCLTVDQLGLPLPSLGVHFVLWPQSSLRMIEEVEVFRVMFTRMGARMPRFGLTDLVRFGTTLIPLRSS